MSGFQNGGKTGPGSWMRSGQHKGGSGSCCSEGLQRFSTLTVGFDRSRNIITTTKMINVANMKHWLYKISVNNNIIMKSVH